MDLGNWQISSATGFSARQISQESVLSGGTDALSDCKSGVRSKSKSGEFRPNAKCLLHPESAIGKNLVVGIIRRTRFVC